MEEGGQWVDRDRYELVIIDGRHRHEMTLEMREKHKYIRTDKRPFVRFFMPGDDREIKISKGIKLIQGSNASSANARTDTLFKNSMKALENHARTSLAQYKLLFKDAKRKHIVDYMVFFEYLSTKIRGM